MSTKLLRRWATNSSGATALIFALALPVMFVASGAAIDYSIAAGLHTKLNAAADAAALRAVAPDMMQASDSAASAAAGASFRAQIGGLSQLLIDASQPTVTITHPNNSPSSRSVTISYTAQSKNIFAGILGSDTIALGGSATSEASIAPNVDFYLLLDNSPSMALPATTSGITLEQTLTTNHCAFACHQAITGDGDTDQNPIVNGKYIDNYQVARNAGVKLRVDELNDGVSQLMATAVTEQQNAAAPAPVYRFSVNALDSHYAVGDPATGKGYASVMPLSANFTAEWAVASPNFGLMEVATNNNVCIGGTVNGVYNPCASQQNNQDGDTNYDNAFRDINALMPSPGAGTRSASDKPQEILFVVTDGVEDEVMGGTRLEQQINAPGAHNYCDDIKGRGVKIAVLYTTYLPIPSNAWYMAKINPFQPKISPALQACASPGMFYEAKVGEDIAAAMAKLFMTTIKTSRLTN